MYRRCTLLSRSCRLARTQQTAGRNVFLLIRLDKLCHLCEVDGSSFRLLLFLYEFVMNGAAGRKKRWSDESPFQVWCLSAHHPNREVGLPYDSANLFIQIVWTKWQVQLHAFRAAVCLVHVEAGCCWLAISRANLISWPGKPLFCSKASILSSLRCRAIGFEESAAALWKCCVATDVFWCRGTHDSKFRLTPLSDGFWKTRASACCPSWCYFSGPYSWQGLRPLCTPDVWVLVVAVDDELL